MESNTSGSPINTMFVAATGFVNRPRKDYWAGDWGLGAAFGPFAGLLGRRS